MSRRLIMLFATVALLMISAVPVSAAPGGVPGPPPGHEKAKDDVAPDVEDDGGDATGLPDWAKAYGKRIKDEYGVPFGHLQQCAGIADGDESIPDAAIVSDDENVKKALEACPDGLEFPEDETGAKAFWVFTETGLLVLGL